MTDEVIGRVRHATHRRLLEYIKHTLAAAEAIRLRTSPDEDVPINQTPRLRPVAVDIERLFAAVDLLVARFDQPWSPFVATWSPGLESFASGETVHPWDLERDLNGLEGALHRFLSAAATYGGGGGAITRVLAEGIQRIVRRLGPGDVTGLLADIRDEMLTSLFEVLEVDGADRVSYLTPLVELARSQGSLTIATLNYDRTIEILAEREALAYDTGIDTWLTRGEFEWNEAGVQLLKLHGSIDWVVERIGREYRALPLVEIKKLNPGEQPAYRQRPAVVFGEAGKLRSEGPYLELLLAWATQLKRATDLLVVGYSFRDDHVNEFIARWFVSDPTRRIVLVDTKPEEEWEVDSFRWNLANANPLHPPGELQEPKRFIHLQGTTADVLAEAVQASMESWDRVFNTPPDDE
jgi:hypothetical protein